MKVSDILLKTKLILNLHKIVHLQLSIFQLIKTHHKMEKIQFFAQVVNQDFIQLLLLVTVTSWTICTLKPVVKFKTALELIGLTHARNATQDMYTNTTYNQTLSFTENAFSFQKLPTALQQFLKMEETSHTANIAKKAMLKMKMDIVKLINHLAVWIQTLLP